MLELLGVWGGQAEAPADVQHVEEEDDDYREVVDPADGGSEVHHGDDYESSVSMVSRAVLGMGLFLSNRLYSPHRGWGGGPTPLWC